MWRWETWGGGGFTGNGAALGNGGGAFFGCASPGADEAFACAGAAAKDCAAAGATLAASASVCARPATSVHGCAATAGGAAAGGTAPKGRGGDGLGELLAPGGAKGGGDDCGGGDLPRCTSAPPVDGDEDFAGAFTDRGAGIVNFPSDGAAVVATKVAPRNGGGAFHGSGSPGADEAFACAGAAAKDCAAAGATLVASASVCAFPATSLHGCAATAGGAAAGGTAPKRRGGDGLGELLAPGGAKGGGDDCGGGDLHGSTSASPVDGAAVVPANFTDRGAVIANFPSVGAAVVAAMHRDASGVLTM